MIIRVCGRHYRARKLKIGPNKASIKNKTGIRKASASEKCRYQKNADTGSALALRKGLALEKGWHQKGAGIRKALVSERRWY
jgi:hypothetical protein